MNLINCFKCRGTKTVLGMGGIMNKCDNCKGVGKVEDDSSKVWTDPANVKTVVTPVMQVESDKVVVTSITVEPAAPLDEPLKKSVRKRKQIQLDMTKPENAYV